MSLVCSKQFVVRVPLPLNTLNCIYLLLLFKFKSYNKDIFTSGSLQVTSSSPSVIDVQRHSLKALTHLRVYQSEFGFLASLRKSYYTSLQCNFRLQIVRFLKPSALWHWINVFITSDMANQLLSLHLPQSLPHRPIPKLPPAMPYGYNEINRRTDVFP